MAEDNDLMRLQQILRQQPGSLFALLDAARDPLVLSVLLNCQEKQQSLYEGPKGERLAACAPYLVQLPSESALLEELLNQGWGQSWGVYLTCSEPFEAVRKHFRRFLTVKTEKGKKMDFRFYDPRVLRIFLPTCTSKESAQFFGPIQSYLLEDDKPETILRFFPGREGAEQEEISLAAK